MSSLDTSRRKHSGARHQRGVSLVELLVGIFLGLLVIGAAISTLMVSRATSSTIGDITQLQQQGSYALRVMGMQFRQAGSIDIEEDSTLTQLHMFKNNYTGFNDDGRNITGTDGLGIGAATDIVSVSNQPAGELPTQRHNCLGNTVLGTANSMDSTFDVVNKELRCSANGDMSSAQAVVQNVADFQARYRVLDGSGTRIMTATQVSAANLWSNVKAVEICLHLEGETKGDASVDGSFVNCKGTSTTRKGKLHVVLRNVFDLRPQGA